MSRSDHASTERFVRGTLGCKCPDEVFETIAIQRACTPDCATRYTRLVVGERLLIYIAHETGAHAARELTSQGLSERNERGYNRFRLVVGCSDPAQLHVDIEVAFTGAAGSDDRAHLHVIATDAVPEVLRPS